MAYFPRDFAEPPSLLDVPTVPATRGELLLINPFYRKDPVGSFGKHVLTPALALPLLAAATPPSWRVRIWDENLLQGPPPSRPFPEVVGITVHLTFAARAYELADWYRWRGAKTVLGGPHVSACPDEAEAHADIVVVGDGVPVWADVLFDLRAGRTWRRYTGSYVEPCYGLHPEPRRDLLPRGAFLTRSSLVATRGCHNRCRFCVLATEGVPMPRQALPVERVVDAIRAADEPYSVFLDNNLGSDRAYLRALCRALEPEERLWSAAVSLDVADDPELPAAMARAGCTGVFIGFESVTEGSLQEAGKHAPSNEVAASLAARFHTAGIQVNGSFVLGFDHDGPDVFARTVEWIEATRLECATFHILTPYPGTPLFRRLDAEGRLLHRDWRLYDTAHAVFRPRLMAPEELEAGYAWCYGKLFSPASMWRRRPAAAGAVPGYLASSLLYKRCNRLWAFLIRHRLVHTMWHPLVAAARRRQLASRRRVGLGTGRAELAAAAQSGR